MNHKILGSYASNWEVYSSTMKMEATSSSVTQVKLQDCTRHRIPEDSNRSLHFLQYM
jgi:hypothetical protein